MFFTFQPVQRLKMCFAYLKVLLKSNSSSIHVRLHVSYCMSNPKLQKWTFKVSASFSLAVLPKATHSPLVTNSCAGSTLEKSVRLSIEENMLQGPTKSVEDQSSPGGGYCKDFIGK